MGLSFADARFKINGLLPTEDSVLQNIEKLSNACATWITYDYTQGKWAVIINRAGLSNYSFTDSNIIGPITISSTGINDLYNSVKITFPHEDLRDQTDFVQIRIPNEDLYPNEQENVLELNYGVVNNQVQAQLLGLIELKQSRIDKVIQFVTDYSSMGIKAGDLIDVTSEVYGFEAKVFRVTNLRETDGDDGTINIEITALEYNANVYDENDINRYEITDENGIVTIGNIGVPGTPTISTTQFSNRPHITITSTAPVTGIIDEMEFWYSEQANVTPDSSRSYNIFRSVKANAGTTFGNGTVVSLDYDGYIPANLVVKTRGVNGQLTGPFSLPSAFSNFTANLYPNSIRAGTPIVDEDGVVLPAATMFSVISGTDRSNVDIPTTKTIGNINAFINGNGIPQTPMFGVSSQDFTAPYDGIYKIDVLFDIAGADLTGGRGLLFDFMTNTYPYSGTEREEWFNVGWNIKRVTDGVVVEHQESGGPGVPPWQDFATSGTANLQVGFTYQINFVYEFYSQYATQAKIGYIDVGYNVYTTANT